MRRPWSFWLTCLLLAALPLKGLAAAGVALCCPQAAAVAALLAAQGLSADPAEDIFRDLAGVERVVRARKSD